MGTGEMASKTEDRWRWGGEETDKDKIEGSYDGRSNSLVTGI